jgi:YHS domain-containing protein
MPCHWGHGLGLAQFLVPIDQSDGECISMEESNGSLMFDPICGMWLDTHEIAITYTYLGQTYTFCCAECRDLFARSAEIHIAHLAHEPHQSAGHRCPFQRPLGS